ncbi:MAG: hypothetical protein ACP5M9_01080 [Candidatus Micrarchaeia archaeon]
MNTKKNLLFLLPIFLTISVIGGSSTTTTYSPTYCNDLFNNVHGIVSPAIYTLSTYTDLLSLTGLIIIGVIIFMSFLYGLGVAFGIDSFKAFAKTEFVESFVNILILMFVVSGIFASSGFMSFFSNLSSSVVPSTIQQQVNSATGIKNVYVTTCNNILNTEVLTGIVILFGSYVQLIGYQLLSGLTVQFSFSGKNSFSLGNLLPSFSITPFAGLGITQAFIYREFAALAGFIGVGIAVILLLFVIYFLFPILFFVGVLFRSFPWTRAAGGSLIALFISFFIIFPSILSAFTFSTAGNILSNISSLCANPSTTQSTSKSSLESLCISSSGSNIISFAQQYGLGSLSGGASLIGYLFANGFGFNSNLSLYSEEVGYYVIMLLGLFIAFIISYDLLGILSKILGSPSFKGSDLFSKVI